MTLSPATLDEGAVLTNFECDELWAEPYNDTPAGEPFYRAPMQAAYAAGFAASARQAQDNAKDAELLRDCKTAMDDWLHSYAPEMCHAEHVAATRRRLNTGGTLIYIARITERLRAAIAAATPGKGDAA